ncbi:unnamed protein product [Schistocephalus solidus]|uniref:Uncharacterized protein n=1 Tax=Schistocephalus solidus TaxID=70667 RepID=A0A183S881_SCHSO|nr:unnamed protein product [Schistocephalus solidus]
MALVTRESSSQKLGIAALSGARFSKYGQLKKVGADHTSWSSRSKARRHDASWRRIWHPKRLPILLRVSNDRLINLRLPFWGHHSSPASAPTSTPRND